MAPNSTLQTRDLYDYLGSYQKVPLLTLWINSCVRFEELKVDHSSFKQMRREKVVPNDLAGPQVEGMS